jgi:hypothetical protein
MLGMLWNRSNEFGEASHQCLTALRKSLSSFEDHHQIRDFIIGFVKSSRHSARLFEIALHSFFQVLESEGIFSPFAVKPLGQMRSANKKHGNVGDVEIIDMKSVEAGEIKVIEAWDAKFGKPNLQEEIKEITEKMQKHPEIRRVGFVVSVDRGEIEKYQPTLVNGVEVEILVFEELIKEYEKKSTIKSLELSRNWLVAFVETLCQQRRDVAPVDEPTLGWVKEISEMLTKRSVNK